MFPLTNFHEDLFSPQKSREKASRKQKRLLKQQIRQDINSELRFLMGELREQQSMDPSLEEVRRLAQAKQFGFFFHNGLMYRQWSPPGRCGSRFEVEQLGLPVKFRPLVMDLSHCIPLASHLGWNKTTSRILQRFYWPTLYRDVKDFCRRYERCQRCSTKKPPKAPLVPLPVINEPFKRIAMDIWVLYQRAGMGSDIYLWYMTTLLDSQKQLL